MRRSIIWAVLQCRTHQTVVKEEVLIISLALNLLLLALQLLHVLLLMLLKIEARAIKPNATIINPFLWAAQRKPKIFWIQLRLNGHHPPIPTTRKADLFLTDQETPKIPDGSELDGVCLARKTRERDSFPCCDFEEHIKNKGGGGGECLYIYIYIYMKIKLIHNKLRDNLLIELK